MNEDMHNVPITMVPGMASLTDLLHQLPLPSPLPATTARSFLYSERVAAEVSRLLASRDENLGSRLARCLSQVCSDNVQPKESLENEDPEGDNMPLLLQAVLSSNPRVFTERSTSPRRLQDAKLKKKNQDKDMLRDGDIQQGEGFHMNRRATSNQHGEEGSLTLTSHDATTKMMGMGKEKMRLLEPKLTLEELMNSPTFKSFMARMDDILENLEDVDFTAKDDEEDDEDEEIPPELLLGRHQLSELSSESAKMKAMGTTYRLPSDKLVKILNIMEKNIRDGATLSMTANPDSDEVGEERLGSDLIFERRVTQSADACLTALNIMTSPLMPKAVYVEEVIERVLQFTRFHLQTTLYPQYDRGYSEDGHAGGALFPKAKRAKRSSPKQKVILMLYHKVCVVVSGLSDLLKIQLLTDNNILQVSSMGITPFFVENVSELQLCSIKLVTAVFARYEKHRQLILEELFSSLARLPTSKRSLRHFRINSSDPDVEPLYIQMVTALVLQLIQCVVHLPSENDMKNEREKKVDEDLIKNSYDTAMKTARNFLLIFMKKCGSKRADEDYRPLFENFVQDLLVTVNRPEWPAAELLLCLLGRLLVHQLSTKQTEMPLRVASLDYLGSIASHLRKDSVANPIDKRDIHHLLIEIPGNDETWLLQKALLNYLDENTEREPSLAFAWKFYVAQWFRDASTETDKAMKILKEAKMPEGPRRVKSVDSTGETLQRAEWRKKFLRKVAKTGPGHTIISPRMNPAAIGYEDCCLIVRHLASSRPFAKSFDIYLTQILRVLSESAIAVRTKAMKCLSEVVAVDPSILSRGAMQRGVHARLMDSSTSVREAAVELVGRFVLSRPHLTEQYYDMLIERTLDTGISVRKRVIKILRDICLEQPDFHKITDVCVRMIRRVNDEEGIKKLVNETFQKMWFTPTAIHEQDTMRRKALIITDVVSACKDSGYDWFEQLLQNLLKSEEETSQKPTAKACIQLVDTIVEHMLTCVESFADCEDKRDNSDHLISSLTTLYLFSKVRAQFLVKHAATIQPYLSTKCNSQNDFLVICTVARIFELLVPLMKEPSDPFLITIEEDLMRLVIKHGMTVVQHCVSCLGAVVNKVTHNYMFIWACFNRYYGVLTKLKVQHQDDPDCFALVAQRPALLRSLVTVGALCRHFDFDQEHFKGANKMVIRDRVLDLLLHFTTHREEVEEKAIIALGSLFIMHPALMFLPDVKTLYNNILSDSKAAVALKVQVLKNLQSYLQEEDSRMQEADRDWQKLSKQEDLKEMGDISSGMSGSIMQLYLKQVLEAFFHREASIRHFALNVITLTLTQGLIHPVQCVPYLIAMGTDPDPIMRNKADQQLVDIDKKYTGFIHMKAVAGMKMSHQVQMAIAGPEASAAVRGFREDETSSALCSHLFTVVRANRQHRRAFLTSLLNQFDDSAKTEVNLLLFIADNLAYFPYQSQEEPLFIMHHIDITLSVFGSNLLQSFKESLRKNPAQKDKRKSLRQERKHHSADQDSQLDDSRSGSSDDDDEEAHPRPQKSSRSSASDSDSDVGDVDAVMERLPDNPAPLLDFSNASQGVLLLLVLKQHLKNLYGFSESKIQKYAPTDSARIYDKGVNRKSKVHFNPQQTLDFLNCNLVHSDLSYEIKRNIVKQFLDFKLLMEHLDPDEEDEEANTNARSKAISALLGSPTSRNHNNNNHQTTLMETDNEDSGDENPSRRRSKMADSAETVEAMDVVALCSPKYKERPQIARVIQRMARGYSVHLMSGSYTGPWAESRKRDGGKLVPRVDIVKESDIIYRKIALTCGHKLTNKVVKTLRALYAAREGKHS